MMLFHITELKHHKFTNDWGLNEPNPKPDDDDGGDGPESPSDSKDAKDAAIKIEQSFGNLLVFYLVCLAFFLFE